MRLVLTRTSTMFALLKTTGKAQHLARGALAGKCGLTVWRSRSLRIFSKLVDLNALRCRLKSLTVSSDWLCIFRVSTVSMILSGREATMALNLPMAMSIWKTSANFRNTISKLRIQNSYLLLSMTSNKKQSCALRPACRFLLTTGCLNAIMFSTYLMRVASFQRPNGWLISCASVRW